MRFFSHFLFIISFIITSHSHAEKLEELNFDDISLKLLDTSLTWSPEVSEQLSKKWETGSVPIVLEMSRLLRSSFMPELIEMMEAKTGQKFSFDHQSWQNWLWKQNYKPLPRYPEFKAELYRRIDSNFADYFKNDAKTTIRLDEVVWGGVQKDGIPPLRDPKMLSVEKASYLNDDDIVFGIEINGEARAYPKRILAWHEMFTDTIQKTPLAGVY